MFNRMAMNQVEYFTQKLKRKLTDDEIYLIMNAFNNGVKQGESNQIKL